MRKILYVLLLISLIVSFGLVGCSSTSSTPPDDGKPASQSKVVDDGMLKVTVDLSTWAWSDQHPWTSHSVSYSLMLIADLTIENLGTSNLVFTVSDENWRDWGVYLTQSGVTRLPYGDRHDSGVFEEDDNDRRIVKPMQIVKDKVLFLFPAGDSWQRNSSQTLVVSCSDAEGKSHMVKYVISSLGALPKWDYTPPVNQETGESFCPNPDEVIEKYRSGGTY